MRKRVSEPVGEHDRKRLRLRVGFILANNFTLSALSLFVDTLRLAADEGDLSRRIQCDWNVMSSGAHLLRASCGLEVHPDSGFLDPSRFDYIAVIGGVLHQGQQIDAATEAYLKRAAAAHIPLIGVCTGTFVLARAGLLRGRKCCVSWYHHTDMVQEFGDVEPVSDRLFLIDGDRITSSGGAGVADLAATLVNRHVGSAAAQKSLSVLLFESPRPDDAPQPLPPFLPRSVSPTLRRVVSLMEQNLEEPLAVQALASRVGVSQRQLSRLFVAELGQPPAAVYRRLRLTYGHWLLKQSSRSVADIAALAGFADGAHFGKEFRRAFGTSPADCRKEGGPSARRTLDLAADRRPIWAEAEPRVRLSQPDGPLAEIYRRSVLILIGRCASNPASFRDHRGRTMKFSALAILRQAFSGNIDWPEQWRSPEPKAAYDAVIVGGGGHGLATAYYMAKEHGIAEHRGRGARLARRRQYRPQHHHHPLELSLGGEPGRCTSTR